MSWFNPDDEEGREERNKWKYRKKHLVSGFESWEILVEYQGIFAASVYSMFLNIHSQGDEGCRHRTPTPSMPLFTSFSYPGSHLSKDAPAQRSAWGPAELSCPAPRKCQGGPGSCSGGAQPPSRLHTWLCSTTSLRGLRQQPSPDSRGVQDIKWEEQASGQLVVCKCHHMDIYQNAAGRGIAGSAPTLF